MNKVYLSGNLTKPPDVRNTQSGKIVCRTSIAVDFGYGENKKTDFFSLIAWEKMAKFFEKYLDKGSKVLIEGRLQNNNYEKDGVKHYTVDVVVDRLEFMDRGRKKSASSDFDGEPVEDEDMPF